MEFTVTQENFAKALSVVGRSTTSKAGLPILSNILLRTDNSRLLVAATNLELASTTRIGAKIVAPGAVTIPAKIITEYVANLPNKPIDVRVVNDNVTLHCEGYSSTIRGVASDDFPELPSIDDKKSLTYEISANEFKHAAQQVVFACSSDQTRPVLTGVFWSSHAGSLYIVGTDGYRLAERRLTETKSDIEAIVPASTIQEVTRILSDTSSSIHILFDETQVRFRVDDSEITSHLIDGKYPDYRQLIPKKSDTNINVNKDDLLRTTKIAGLFARDIGGSVTMSADKDSQKLTINSISSDVGENSTTLDATVDNSNQIALNSRYLNEALNVIGSRMVTIAFSSKLSPITINGDEKSNYTHIIMPLKS